MLSVAGIYDGKSIYPVEKIRENKQYKVIITFVEELIVDTNDMEDIRQMGTNNAALSFWNDTNEDIYQDYLPKKTTE